MVLADVGDSFQQAMDEFFAFLPNLLGAIVILIIGWIVARLVGRLVESGLRSVGADRALATGTAGEYRERIAPAFQPSRLIGRIAFWFVLGLAILLAVSALGIEALSQAVGGVVSYLPNVIAAILILTYVLVLGAIALGFALAFGLGGRSVAQRMLEGAYVSGQQAMPQMKMEAQMAKRQAAADAETVRQKVEERSDSGPGATTRRPA